MSEFANLSEDNLDKWIERLENHLFKINHKLEVLDADKKEAERVLRGLRKEKRGRTDQ